MHGTANTKTVFLLYINLEHAQLQAGLDKPLHNLPTNDLQVWAKSWWTMIAWNFITNNNTSLYWRDMLTPLLQCIDDKYLIQLIYDYQSFSKIYLRSINNGIIFFEVITMKDISIEDSIRMNKATMDLEEDNTCCRKYIW